MTITVSSGTEPYQFTLGSESNNTGVFYDVAPGSYGWSFNDASSCDPVTGTLPVTEPDLLTFSSQSVTEVSCSGEDDGQIEILATGGTGTITYTISPETGVQSPSGTFSEIGRASCRGRV